MRFGVVRVADTSSFHASIGNGPEQSTALFLGNCNSVTFFSVKTRENVSLWLKLFCARLFVEDQEHSVMSQRALTPRLQAKAVLALSKTLCRNLYTLKKFLF